MNKELKSDEQGDIHGYNYFENLPDELVILIFTKLSSTNDKHNFVDDIQSLGRCSIVTVRFGTINSKLKLK